MQLTEIVLHSTSIIVVVIAAILALQLIRLSGKTNTWIYLSVGILLLAIASFEQYLEHTGISAGLFTNHVFIDALRLGTSVLMLVAVISGVSIFRERKMGLELIDKQIQRLQHAPPESEIGMTDSERATRQALIRSGRSGVSVVTALQYLRDEEQRITQMLKDWQATFDAITIPVFVYDRSYRLIRANRAYLERAGATMQDIIGKPYFDVFPKSGSPIIDPPQNAGRGISGSDIRLATGEIFTSRNFPIYSDNNEYRYTLHTLQEVTVVKQAEKSIRRIRLSLQVVANCIRGMLRESDEAQMLHTICKMAVNSGLYRTAWIGRAEQDEKKTLRLLASHGHAQDPRQLPDSTWGDTEDSRTPMGVAIRVIPPIFTGPKSRTVMQPWPDAALG
ncbi:MAG: PAS domain-containing protein [Pseudomonadota bacterium]|nr:PAS domain-containing protein [Pseudomonadota bacterium]